MRHTVANVKNVKFVTGRYFSRMAGHGISGAITIHWISSATRSVNLFLFLLMGQKKKKHFSTLTEEI